MDSKGPVLSRNYLVRWKGYSEADDTWEPRSNMTGAAELIKEYEVREGLYDNMWPHRCDICDKPCKSARGVKIHKTKSHPETIPQQFKGSLAEKKAVDEKIKILQKDKSMVTCEGVPLDNVDIFKYLGTLFTTLTDQMRDVKARVAQAMTRCGRLRNIFDAKDIDLKLKLRLYEASVCSILTFGCETWDLNRETIKTLNGANSTMLARFTGLTISQEARSFSTNFNLIHKIRQRRLRWVGHILRAGPDRLTFHSLRAQLKMNHEGHLLTDTPPFTTLEDLAEKAMDRAAWSEHTNSIPHFY